MKIRTTAITSTLFVALTLWLADPVSTRAATLNWTNTASGGWNTAANWNLNQVPGSGDTAVITNAGVTVSLNSSTTVGGIILGTNGPGTVTLSLAGQTLTLNGPLTVNPSGSFTVDSGMLVGNTNAVLRGTIGWTAGLWEGILTLASTGTLNITSGNNHDMPNCTFTNSGTVAWASGAMRSGQSGTTVYNYGLWDAQSDQSWSPSGYGGTTVFNNYGTFRKSGGTGEFSGNTVFASGVAFNQLAGAIDVQNGANGLQLGFNGGGNFTGGYITTNVNGLTVFGAGSFTVNGTVTGTNTWQDTGNLVGANVINGALTWVGGNWNSAASVTIATNATLIVAGGGGVNDMASTVVTNYGKVAWASGTIRSGQNGTTIYNYGLWDAQSDQTWTPSGYGGTTVFNDYGMFRKSGGTNTSSTVFAGGVVFNQLAGAIDVQSGNNGLNLYLQGGGSFTGGYITTNQSGWTYLSSGSFTLNGTVTGTNTWLNGGNLAANNVINGALTWQAGNWNSAASVTIATNATLIVAGGGGVNDMASTVVTNYGKVAWASGTIRSGQSGTTIYNYGLWDAQSDQTWTPSGYGGPTVFNNYGTFRKSGGAGEFSGNTVFASGVTFNQLAGVLDVQNSTSGLQLSLQGGGNFTGGYVTTNSQGLLNLAQGNFTLNGTMTGTNTWENSVNLAGNNVINGALTWVAGNWNSAASVTIASNATLIVAGGGGNGNNDMASTVVTNCGKVTWASGTIRSGQNGTTIYNYGLWDAQSDQTWTPSGYGGTTVFNDYGTFRKSGGTNTSSTVFAGGVVFNQLAGVIDVQSGNNGLNLYLQGGGSFTDGYITTNQSGWTYLSSGNFTLNGTVTGTNTAENGGYLVGTNVIRGALQWQTGNWNSAPSVTLNSGGTLYINTTTDHDLANCVFTNNGSVVWTAGRVRCGGTTIYNYGLWDSQGDLTINNDYGGVNNFNNLGTFRKSAGTGTTLLYPAVYDWGTVDAETGTVQLNSGGGFYNGSVLTGPGVALLAGGNFTLTGIVNSSSNAVLAGSASLTGANGVLSGLWTWNSGSISGSSTLTVATNGMLVLTGSSSSTYNAAGTLTNAGRVEVRSGTLYFTGNYVQTAGLTYMNGGNLQAAQPIQVAGGTLQGAGTITGSVTNNGTFNPGNPLGPLTITGNYAQTANGVLNIVLAGLPGSTNWDRLVVNGTASVAGTLNASQITNLYLLVGNQYPVVAAAGGLTGVYGSTNLAKGFGISYTNTAVNLVFQGVPGDVYRFAWAPIPTLQYSGVPFRASIAAQDFQNNLATNFSSTVALGLNSPQKANILGGPSPYSSYYYYYPTTYGYSFTPAQDILVTAVRSYFGTKVSIWQSNGSLVASQPVGGSGSWTETPLATPVTLSGGQTYVVGAYTGGYGVYAYYRTDGSSSFANGVINQSLAYYSGTGTEIPNNPTPGYQWWLVDLAYQIGSGLSTNLVVAPATTGNFTNGFWSGMVTLTGTGTNVVLKAVDAVGHNGAANSVTVWGTNDVALFGSATPNPVGLFSNLTYTLQVLNPGPSNATGVIITNTLPAGVSFVSASASQGTCSTNGALVICNLGTLTSGVTATATIVATPTIANALLTNVAMVVRNEVDANPTNNVATNTVTSGPGGVSIADTSVVEGDVGTTNAVFSLTLNAPSAQTVTVAYSTANGTAVGGLDYLTTSGVVTFAPGVTNQTIAVPVVGYVEIDTNVVFYVQLSNPTNVTILRAQAAGTIINNEALAGQVYQLVWNPIGNPQSVNNAFSATLSARDANGALATNCPSASLSAWAAGTVTNNVTGTGTSSSSSLPIYTYYPQSRSQTIYLTSEVGAAGLLTALALNTVATPSVTLTNFTIRLRPTFQMDYSGGPYWETDGWTTVYSGNLAITSTGWVNCAFSAPFYYNGTNNLLVDLSCSNAVYGASPYGSWTYTSASANRAMYYYGSYSGSAYANPLTWSGTSPSYYTASTIPNLQFTKTPVLPATLSTNTAAPFVAGVWTGPLKVSPAALGVRLLADDGNGHTAWSSPFDVLAANDLALYAGATPNPVNAGSNLTFQLTVANAGPTAATGVIVTNPLPPNVNLVSAVASQGSLSTNGGLVVCNLGTLTNGVTATATIVVRPTLAGVLLTNVTMMVRNEVEANLTNNVVTNIVTVSPAGVSISDTSVVEGDVGTTNAVFGLVLNAPSAQTVTVAYSTANWSAVAGSDYLATNGLVTFVPGVTNQTIAVPVIGDIVVESNKMFYVNLSNPTNVTLVRAQAVGTIIDDDSLPGKVQHFSWAPINSPQRIQTPFPVTITAQDYNNNVASSFTGAVSLQIVGGISGNTAIGNGTGYANYPLGAGNVDQRSQVIYLASELGGPGHLTGLSLNVNDLLFSTTLGNFTIRVKHTPLSSYSVPYAWDGSGWTVVYQTNLTVTATGWLVCNFMTPFDYNGVDNLMVDFSFSTSFLPFDSCFCASSPVGAVRSLMYQAGGAFGNPSGWSGTVNPSPQGFAAIPNLSLAWNAVGLLPASTASFTNGVWSGNLTLAGLGTNVVLQAVDAVGHSGTANPLTLLGTNDLALSVSATPNPVGVVSNLTYALQVMNAGPNSSTGVRITNTLPAGVSLVSASASQGTCSTNGALVICNLGTLANGAAATATIVVTPMVPSAVLTNVTVVVRNELDTNPANNVVTNIVTVGPAGVSIADTSVGQGNSGTTNAVFSLALNASSAQTVTVTYSTANWTGVAGTDYVATNGVVTFAPGVTNQTIVVPVIGGIVVVPNKMFYVNLNNPVNAVLVRKQAVGTIINDDGLPGRVYHFVWSAISSAQHPGTAFRVTITALDLNDNLAGSFSGTAALSLSSGSTPSPVLTPAATGNFTNGVWSGMVTVTGTGTDVLLQAMDAVGHSGISNPFDVLLTALSFDTSPGSLQMTNGAFRLRVIGSSGLRPVVIYASTNLVSTWVPLYTNPATTAPIEYLDSTATSFPRRFYRVLEQ